MGSWPQTRRALVDTLSMNVRVRGRLALVPGRRLDLGDALELSEWNPNLRPAHGLHDEHQHSPRYRRVLPATGVRYNRTLRRPRVRECPRRIPCANHTRDAASTGIQLSNGLDQVSRIEGEVVATQVSAFDNDEIHGWTVYVTGARRERPPQPVGAENLSGRVDLGFRAGLDRRDLSAARIGTWPVSTVLSVS